MRMPRAALAAATAFASVAALVGLAGPAFALGTTAVTAGLGAATTPVGRAVTISGLARPIAGRPVLLQVFSAGAWHRYGTAQTGAYGGFRLSFRPATAGTWRLRVYAPPASTSPAGVSPSMTLLATPSTTLHPLVGAGSAACEAGPDGSWRVTATWPATGGRYTDLGDDPGAAPVAVLPGMTRRFTSVTTGAGVGPASVRTSYSQRVAPYLWDGDAAHVSRWTGVDVELPVSCPVLVAPAPATAVPPEPPTELAPVAAAVDPAPPAAPAPVAPIDVVPEQAAALPVAVVPTDPVVAPAAVEAPAPAPAAVVVDAVVPVSTAVTPVEIAQPGSAPIALSPPRPTPLSAADAYELRILQLVNDARAAAGAAPLVLASCADVIAAAWAPAMAAAGVLSHQSMTTYLDGCAVTSAGENLASTQGTADDLVALWLASPGHRDNLLDPTWTHTGIAVCVGADGTNWGVQGFLAA